MKTIITTLTLLSASYLALAQNADGNASQQMELALSAVVNVDMFTGGSGGGSTVAIPVEGMSAMSDGVESPEIEVTLQGTADFDISVQASATTFTYTGSATSDNSMPVADVLQIKVTANNTGGTVSSGFGTYQSVDGLNSKKLIGQGLSGVRSFKFRYKASPGFNYAAGIYTTDIVYTLTTL